MLCRAEGIHTGRSHWGHQHLRQLLQKEKKERERKRKSKKEKAGIEEPEGPVHEHHWKGIPEKNLSC